MKKLYHGKARRVHPSPPPPTASPPPWTHLAALPAALLSLAATLTPEEQEVLSYLLSGGGAATSAAKDAGKGRRKQPRQRRCPHDPDPGCGCFGCYKTFWARWDASPNRHVIHLIIDAFEETLESTQERVLAVGPARDRRRAGRRRVQGGDVDGVLDKKESGGHVVVDGGHVGDDDGDDDDDDDDGYDNDDEDDGGSKSSVRRLVSFIGERVWGVWN